MNDSYNVIVIGAGIAGTAAAICAARAGARTAIVRSRPGATALCSGGWRGVFPAGLTDALRSVGYHVVPALAPLPMPDGSLHAFSECHAPHAIPWQAGTVVCGIAGIPAWHATVLARCWSSHAKVDLAAATLELGGTPSAGWSPASLARRIERNPDLVCEAVPPGLRRDAAALLLPPILGVEEPEATRAAIETRLDVPVFEAMAGTPSLPGWRLQRALDAVLEHAGVDVLAGHALGGERQNGRVTAVSILAVEGHTTRHHADRFILATGKYVGGGIAANGTLAEPVFDLPVWIDHLGERFTTVEPIALTNAARSARQPLLDAGVATDDSGRPVGPDGSVLLGNVLVAGVVRAGIGGSTMDLGHAATDGWAAGARVAA